MTLPTVVASSVIRSSQQGDSHGGVYLVDLADGSHEQVLDWDSADIDWSGRGGDRGLRGIAFHDGYVFLAASDELFIFDHEFRRLDTYRNRYFKHCHEIHRVDDVLLLTSTGFDSVLEMDLRTGRFSRGHRLEFGPLTHRLHKRDLPVMPRLTTFDPESADGPEPSGRLHLNSVWASEGTIFATGTNLKALLAIRGGRVRRYARLPRGTHNARPFDDDVLMNDTGRDRVVVATPSGDLRRTWQIPHYDEDALRHGDIPEDHARQGFARGLCVHRGLIVAGSSPATITVYDLEARDRQSVTSVNLTLDVRNAIHGLEVWPY